MSTQMRGFAPAMRVMSRNEPPACASGSCPSTREAPVWLATMFASTCGTWLVSATSRSCAAASIATGVAPTSEMKPWTSRCRSGSVCATGVRNHVAPSKSPALAFSAPRVSEPQIGWPPTNRGEPSAASTTLDLVEPTSVTVASPGAASTASTVAGSCAIGEATTTSSASATASSRLGAAVDCVTRDGRGERVRVGVPAGDVVAAPPRGERDGGAYQAGSDHRDLHVSALGRTAVRRPEGVGRRLLWRGATCVDL